MRLKNVISFSAGTLFSRILGFVREATIAYLLGGKDAADAFYVAFRIPNLLRDLFAENSVQTAFVPSFVEAKEKKQAPYEFADSVFTLTLIVLGIITLLGIFLAPFVVKLIAYGFTKYPEKFHLASSLTRITFPFLLFISLSAVLGGILNSYKKFFVPAVSPVLYNIVVISSGVFAYFVLKEAHYPHALAGGVVTGGIVQFLFQWPFVRREGVKLRLRVNLRHPMFQKFFKLLLPVVLSVSFVNLTLFFNTEIASFLGRGAVAYLSYAFRIMHLPIAIFGVAVSTVILPGLVEKFARGENMTDEFEQGMALLLFLIIPASVFMIKDAPGIVGFLFQRGHFTHYDTIMVAQALVFYAPLIVPSSLAKLFQSLYFAQGKVKIPNYSFAIAGVINILLAWYLGFKLGFPGIALASFIAIALRFVVLSIPVFRTMKDGGVFLHRMIKVVILALLFGLFVFTFNPFGDIENMFFHLFIGFSAYYGLGYLWGMFEIKRG